MVTTIKYSIDAGDRVMFNLCKSLSAKRSKIKSRNKTKEQNSKERDLYNTRELPTAQVVSALSLQASKLREAGHLSGLQLTFPFCSKPDP